MQYHLEPCFISRNHHVWIPSLHISPNECVVFSLRTPSLEPCNLSRCSFSDIFSPLVPFLINRMEFSRALNFFKFPGCSAAKQLFPLRHPAPSALAGTLSSRQLPCTCNHSQPACSQLLCADYSCMGCFPSPTGFNSKDHLLYCLVSLPLGLPNGWSDDI